MRGAVVVLGEVNVVRAAHQPDVLEAVCAALAERVVVVELQRASVGAAPAVRGDERAPIAVALANRAADRGRDVPARPFNPPCVEAAPHESGGCGVGTGLLVIVVIALAAGCKDKVPSALKDVESVANTGKLQIVTDTSFGVRHDTEVGETQIFEEYAAALEDKGWTRTSDVAKPHTDPPAHNGCIERDGKQLSVAASRQKDKTIGVIVTTTCVGI